jgi:UDP-N-acetylmuramoylalanine--D-glutamate ligase
VCEQLIGHEVTQANLDGFEAPKGRLELVKTDGQVSFYNDNTATEPDAVVAAIEALLADNNSQLWLILAGKYKKGNHIIIAEAIKKYQDMGKIFRVDYCGEVGGIIKNLFISIGGKVPENKNSPQLRELLSDKTGARAIISKALVGDKHLKVVLSPGGSSFDEFNNYIERGELYLKWVSNF